jgi:hypothetical protein
MGLAYLNARKTCGKLRNHRCLSVGGTHSQTYLSLDTARLSTTFWRALDQRERRERERERESHRETGARRPFPAY